MGSSHSTVSSADFTGPAIGALKAIQGASEAIPVPYIPLAAGLLASLLENIQTMNENKEDLLQLASDATQLVLVIITEYQRPDNQKDWAGKDCEDAGNTVVVTLLEITRFVEKRAMRRWWRRFLTTIVDKGDISKYRTKLNFAATKFQIILQLGQRQDLQNLKKMAVDIVGKLQAVAQEIHLAFDKKQALGDLKQWVSPDAKHYSSARVPAPRCDKGSRELVTKHIVRWCRAPVDGEEQDGEEQDGVRVQGERHILWLHAPYGSGKSAIMQSLSELLDQLKDTLKRPILGGTFFFGRDQPSRNQAKLLIPTIAEQIAQKFPEFHESLLRAISQDPTILEKVDAHASNLLIGPLSKCVTPFSDAQPLIILIDGLDECEKLDGKSKCTSKEAQRDVLKAVRLLSESKLHLRIVVASRPEEHIECEFEGVLKPMSTPLSLQDDKWLSEGRKNVAKTIRDGFKAIHKKHPQRLGEHWPKEGDLKRVIEAAEDQYLYAHTVLEFVRDGEFLPDKQLSIVLNSGSAGHAKAFSPMDALLRYILGTCPEQQRDTMLLALAALTVRPQSASSLAALVDSDADVDLVTIILRRLAGIIGTNIRYQEEVDPKWHWLANDRLEYKIHHISTQEFLESKDRSEDFYIGIRSECVAKLQANACALLLQMVLGELSQVRPDMLDACEHSLSNNNGRLLLMKTLLSLMDGNGLQIKIPLTLTQRKGLWVVKGLMQGESVGPVVVACENLRQTDILHHLRDRTTAKLFQTLLEVRLHDWGAPLLETFMTRLPSFYETIMLFSDIFNVKYRDNNWHLDLAAQRVEMMFLYEVREATTPIGAAIYSSLLRASTTVFSSLYADEHPGREKSWVSHLESGSTSFDWYFLSGATICGGTFRPTQELRGFLKNVVEILANARGRPSKILAQLFEPPILYDIQWWVWELAQSRRKSSTLGIEYDPLSKDIGQLLEEFDEEVKELESRRAKEMRIRGLEGNFDFKPDSNSNN